MTLTEMIEQRTALLAEADQILSRNDDNLEGVDAQRFTDLKGELERLRPQIEREERRSAVMRAAGNTDARLSGDGTDFSGNSFQHMRRVNAWDGNGDNFDRARAAVEQVRLVDVVDADKTRQRMAKMLDESQGNDPVLSEFVTAVSDPNYYRAFMTVLTDPVHGHQRWTAEESAAFRATKTRSAMSLTDANGGYLVPFTLDPSIILTNSGTINPVRRLARNVTTTSDTWNGVTSAGVSAEWLAEAVEAADASPTFGQPSIRAEKGSAYLQASFEVAADSGIANDVGMLIADAKDRLEATAFTVGSGSGQPYGVVTRVSAVTASRVAGTSGAAGAADFVAADLYAVDNALASRWRANAAWLGHVSTINRIRQFAAGSGQQHSFIADLGMGQPSMMLGHPLYEASDLDSSIVSGSNDDILLLGDFRQGYVVVDRIGTTIAYNPLVLGSNRRPTAECAWFAYFRVGGDVTDPAGCGAFKLLRI